VVVVVILMVMMVMVMVMEIVMVMVLGERWERSRQTKFREQLLGVGIRGCGGSLKGQSAVHGG
jgi:hypothetical protein